MRVLAEWSSATDSSSGVSDQQSVGSSPGLDTCLLVSTIIASHFGWSMNPETLCCIMHVKQPSILTIIIIIIVI